MKIDCKIDLLLMFDDFIFVLQLVLFFLLTLLIISNHASTIAMESRDLDEGWKFYGVFYNYTDCDFGWLDKILSLIVDIIFMRDDTINSVFVIFISFTFENLLFSFFITF